MGSFISVIIATYNRAPLLRRALLALSQQILGPNQFEVIVVDDGSKDDTAAVCEAMRREVPSLRYVSTGTNDGVAHARNVGIGVATGDPILFTDDDCLPAPQWVERMSAALEREAIVGGAVESPVSNFVKLCHNIAQFHAYMPGQKSGPMDFIAGANMGFQRSVLEELNGFNADIETSEDMEFILRAREKGYSAYFIPDAVVTHDPDRTTLRSIFTYAAQHAATTICLRNRYQSFLRTPFVLRSPQLLLATAPVIAMTVTTGIYLHNRNIAKRFWTAPMVYALKLAWCWGAARGLRNQAAAPEGTCPRR